MKTKISILSGGTIPAYQTKHSAGFDIASAINRVIEPKKIVKIPTGLVIESPPGYFLMIVARSSLAIKKRLMLANSIGVIDRDYSGPNDEIELIMYNYDQYIVKIKKGERLAQGIFIPYTTAEFEAVEQINYINRGGIGSSGGYNE